MSFSSKRNQDNLPQQPMYPSIPNQNLTLPSFHGKTPAKSHCDYIVPKETTISTSIPTSFVHQPFYDVVPAKIPSGPSQMSPVTPQMSTDPPQMSQGPQQKSQMSLVTPKITTGASQMSPEPPHNIFPNPPQMSPVTPNMSPVTPQMSPVTPNMSPVTPQMSPVTPNMSPVTPQMPPLPKAEGFRHVSVYTQCPSCGSYTWTSLHYELGTLVWAMCFLIALVGCFAGCCLVPFWVKGCKDVVHTCPKCRHTFSKWNRL